MFVGLLGIMVACQQSSTGDKTAATEMTSQQDLQSLAASVNPTDKLALPVTGMSCEMACGGAIRKALIETKAVNRVQFDFQMARDTNVAYISYDANKIQEKELISLIEKINDGQFHTGNSTSTSLEVKGSGGSHAGNTQSSTNVFSAPQIPQIKLPSILDILRSIIFN